MVGRLHQIGNAMIRVYANDHLPAHFHIITPDHEALVDLATMRVLRGTISGANGTIALAWAVANRAAVVAEWNRINPRFPTARGEPR